LLIAATAERHDVNMLHYYHDYGLIAAVTEQQIRWIVPRGTADIM
jgi:predicted nucleic acid-binding protein